jgi:hypothetical protein
MHLFQDHKNSGGVFGSSMRRHSFNGRVWRERRAVGKIPSAQQRIVPPTQDCVL